MTKSPLVELFREENNPIVRLVKFLNLIQVIILFRKVTHSHTQGFHKRAIFVFTFKVLLPVNTEEKQSTKTEGISCIIKPNFRKTCMI